jgi:uncharacterized membrane protein
MKQSEYLIGIVLRLGLWLSVLIVLIGGTLYLLQNGHQIIPYHVFQASQNAFANKGIWGSFSFTPEGIIQLGLLTLIITQILRIALLVWLFAEEKDYFFIMISVGILIVLIYSVFLRK